MNVRHKRKDWTLIFLIFLAWCFQRTPGETAVTGTMAKVSGRVVDESNAPVNAARVAVVARPPVGEVSGRRLRSEVDTSELTTTTDARGDFQLLVPAGLGEVTLVARAPDYAPARQELSIQAGQDRMGVLLRLPAGLEARGRVVEDSGAPIPGVVIVARYWGEGRDAPVLRRMDARSTSGSDGSFLLRGLEEGVHTIEVSDPEYAALTVPRVKIEANTANRIPELVLMAGTEIRGRVADAAGNPIDGAAVSGRTVGARESETTAGSDGRFVLGGLLPGASVVVSATATGYGPTQREVTAPRSDVTLVVSRNGRLRGRVDDAETKNPITEFQMQVAAGRSASSLPSEIVHTRTFRSEDGRFEWEDLPPGTWSFSAQAPGYRRTELHGVEILPGEPTEELVFSLKTDVSLVGRVVDAATGLGVADAKVSYQDSTVPETPDWNFRLNMRSVTTDPDGNFKLEALWPGKVIIIVHSPGYADARKEVVAGEERFAEIKLGTGGSVSGRVDAEDANIVTSEAWVELWDVGGQSGMSIRTDEAGAFSFYNLRAGRYRIRAETSHGQTRPREILLRENERLTGVLLVLEEGATIRGRVRGLAPGELQRLRVLALGPRDFMTSASTDPEGVFILRGVPAGGVRVSAMMRSGRSISKFIEVPEDIPELSLDIDFPSGSRLSGQVRQAGQPVAAAVVSASPVTAQFASGSAKTDQDGMYEIDGLSEADYMVSVAGRGSKSVHISGETVMDIELHVSSLSGLIVEAGSAEPLPGVNVQVSGLPSGGIANGSRTATTDALGRFSLEGVEPGSYQLAAHKPGFELYTETVSVPDGDANVTLSLRRAEGIKIRVKDGISGMALRSATIHVLSGVQAMHFEVALDERGEGEIPQLSPGHYDLRVSSAGYASKALVGWTVPGAGSSLTLLLTPGGRLEIQTDPAHAAVKASLVDANGIPFLLGHTRDPWFTLAQPCIFPNLSPGAYRLLVYLPEGSKSYEASILEGRSTVVHVR